MSDRSDLAGRLAAIEGARVAVLGDVMLDRYVHGAVERISPEGPIPVLRVERERQMLGGAGNVARNVVALGAKAVFATVVGDDPAGEEVLRLIADEEGIDPRVVREPGRPTTIKTRFVAAGQQLLRADSETTRPIGDAARRALVEHVGAAVGECGALVLSEYDKGLLGPDLVTGIVAEARRHGCTVVVDPKGTDFARFAGADLITPNRAELAAATGLPTDGDDEVVAAARRLIEITGISTVLATRGPRGMALVRAEGAPELLAAEALEVFDVSGAGDTVVAAVAAALAAGVPLSDAARLANTAAGIVVGKAGTAVAAAAEVAATLRAQDLLTGGRKVVALPDALARVEAWRRRSLRIGFTNGCFDLLHPGHVSLLDQAKAACDRLVVGLNSDASVARLKGNGRPIQSEAARAAVLGSLASVDLVVVFGEDTPLALIEAIRPDVLVKGADYTLDQVVGADLVRGYGGEVLLARLEPGHSTSATIARIGN